MTTNAYSICHPLQIANAQLGDTIYELCEERENQDQQWGEQNHPVWANEPASWVRRKQYLAEAEAWKVLNDLRAKDGNLAWDGILLEEVYEALSEEDPDKRRAELIQVAAVAVAMVECEDRRRAAEA